MPSSVKDYLSPDFTLGSIDRYYARTSILEAIRAHRQYLTGILLDVGCGKMHRTFFMAPPRYAI